jgi:two-component system response regulator FimZ (fimbrial Z protein)/two-component system response regulator EvgA
MGAIFMRIILADHHTQACWALKTLLEEQPEFDLVGDADDANLLLELAKKHLPDVILVDCELPGIYIEDLISSLHALEPSPTVIVMSSEFENSRKLLKAGADAFVSKGDQPDWLLEILRKYEIHTRSG